MAVTFEDIFRLYADGKGAFQIRFKGDCAKLVLSQPPHGEVMRCYDERVEHFCAGVIAEFFERHDNGEAWKAASEG